jgi:hypothetical protein
LAKREWRPKIGIILREIFRLVSAFSAREACGSQLPDGFNWVMLGVFIV